MKFAFASGLLRSRVGPLRGARGISWGRLGLLGSEETGNGLRLGLLLCVLCLLGIGRPCRTRFWLNRSGVCHPLLALAAHELVHGRVGIGDVMGKHALVPLRRTGHVRKWRS